MDGSDMSAAPSSTVTENKSQRRQRLKAELETLQELVSRIEARQRALLAVAEPTSSHDSRNNMGSDNVAVSYAHGHSREQQPVASGRRHSREGSHSRQNSGTEAGMGNDLDLDLAGTDFTKERRAALGARMSITGSDFEKDGAHHGDAQVIKRRKLTPALWEGGEGDLAYEGPEARVWHHNGSQSQMSMREGHDMVTKRRLADLAPEAERSPKRMKAPTGIPASVWQICMDILEQLIADPEAWPFSQPVRVLWPDLVEYFDVIKDPQDLSTVKSALLAREYSHPREYARDVRLTFNNALKYNQKTSEYYLAAKRLKAKFDSKFRTVERRLLTPVQPSSPPVAMPEVLDRRHSSSDKVNGLDRYGQKESDGLHDTNGSHHVVAAAIKVGDAEHRSMARPGLEDSIRERSIKELRSGTHSSKVESGKSARLPKPSKKLAREKSLPTADPKAGAVVDPRLGRAKSAKAYGGPRPLTNKEKLKLTELVQDLPADRQNMIYKMVSSKVSANSEAPQQETAEFDMNSIDDMTMFEVFRVTMNWQKSKSKVLGTTKAVRGSKGKDDSASGQPSAKAKQSHQKSKPPAIDVGHKAGAEEEDVDIMNDSPTPHRGGAVGGEPRTENDAAAGDESPRHSSSGSSSNDSSSSSSSGSDSSSSGSESDAESGGKD